MDVEAVLRELEEAPDLAESARRQREVLDLSESGDSDALAAAVERFVEFTGGGAPSPGDQRTVDRQRRVEYRQRRVEFYAPEEIGPDRRKTPEGFLVCLGVPVARTGEMIYGPGETPIPLGRDGRVRITRDEREVFAPDSVASLAGKPVTDDHPPVNVGPDNWRQYMRGVVVNPRRGEGARRDFLVADIIIYDAETIRDVESGKREVSCGYDPQYLQVLDEAGRDVPGEGEQVDIIYNHLALVERGRCGPRCSIGDRRTADHATKTERRGFMTIRSAIRSLERAFRAKDERAFDDAIGELEEKVEEGKPGGDAAGDPADPEAIEIHNYIPDPAAAGANPAAMADAEVGEMPPWFREYAAQCDQRFQALHDAVGSLTEWARQEEREPAHGSDDDPELGLDPANPEVDAAGDPDDPANLNMDSVGRRRRRVGNDARNDEKNREILGELEFEAPPGTGDRARSARDSAYLAEAFQDAAARAEIIAPGVSLPTFDRGAPPARTLRTIGALRRTALDLAYAKAETRGAIDAALGGRTLDVRRMPHGQVRVLFNAVAGNLADGNRRSGAADTRGSFGPLSGGGLAVGRRAATIADLNARNAEIYGRRRSA